MYSVVMAIVHFFSKYGILYRCLTFLLPYVRLHQRRELLREVQDDPPEVADLAILVYKSKDKPNPPKL